MELRQPAETVRAPGKSLWAGEVGAARLSVEFISFASRNR
jgi:hypothetical protein